MRTVDIEPSNDGVIVCAPIIGCTSVSRSCNMAINGGLIAHRSYRITILCMCLHVYTATLVLTGSLTRRHPSSCARMSPRKGEELYRSNT